MIKKHNNNNFSIVWLGESGFPYGLAAIQNAIVIGDTLVKAGARVTVINRKGKVRPGYQKLPKVKGEYQGIQYVYVSGITYRPNNFFKRNLNRLKGAIKEFSYLRKLRFEDNLDAAIVSNRNFFQTLLYLIYGTILSFPVIYLYVELASAMQDRRRISTQIEDYLFENFLLKRMNGALPISELLIKKFQKIAPGKPFLKIPAICDFEAFNFKKGDNYEFYFLYCGAFGYREIINFILEAYDKLDDSISHNLYLLVSGGTTAQYNEFAQYIKKFKFDSKIRLFSNVPFSKLIELYVNASALLIPLRPTMQDAARFPHKIAEYTATGNPIITTNYGEIPHYFEDGKNALIAKSYDTMAFAEKMQIAIDDPEKSIKIGKNGKDLGLKEFSHLKYGPILSTFLKEF